MTDSDNFGCGGGILIGIFSMKLDDFMITVVIDFWGSNYSFHLKPPGLTRHYI